MIKRLDPDMEAGDRPEFEIEITREMIEAGVFALHDAMGFQLDGPPSDGVIEVFRAMLPLVPECRS